MNDKPELQEAIEPEIVEIAEEQTQTNTITEVRMEDLTGILPKMNIAAADPTIIQKEPPLISDEQFLSTLNELIGNIKEDRQQVSEYIENFADMIINDGDATSSSKEALVNLVKIKTDLQDKMLKAADLMARTRSKNTYAFSGPHMNTLNQQNNYIDAKDDKSGISRKEFIRAINQSKKKKEKE